MIFLSQGGARIKHHHASPSFLPASMSQSPPLHPETAAAVELSAQRAVQWVAEAASERLAQRNQALRAIIADLQSNGFPQCLQVSADQFCGERDLLRAKHSALNYLSLTQGSRAHWFSQQLLSATSSLDRPRFSARADVNTAVSGTSTSWSIPLSPTLTSRNGQRRQQTQCRPVRGRRGHGVVQAQVMAGISIVSIVQPTSLPSRMMTSPPLYSRDRSLLFISNCRLQMILFFFF
jgi:hypothetical protein